jgi:diguanylate cyclase (GGDEF)-like protein
MWLSEVLVVTGLFLLVKSLNQIRRLIFEVPHGQLRVRWQIMALLNVAFILGYLAYGIFFSMNSRDFADLIVPVIFFAGSGFVWLASSISLLTVVDLRRVAILEQENIMDPLTGIYNRRYLERRLEDEFVKAKRHGLPLSLLILDIDHFKQVNDTFGHQAGDLVLSHIGKLLLAAARTSDVVARFGGEEFMLIAAQTDVSGATSLAERVRQYVERHPLTIAGERRKEIKVTISVGVAFCTAESIDVKALIAQADSAMYEAKQNGRNRTQIFGGKLPLGVTVAESAA